MDLKPGVNTDRRRSLPSVDQLGRQLVSERPDLPRWACVEGARRAIAKLRERLEEGSPGDTGLAPPVTLAAQHAQELATARPRRVINATGVVLHTNLGRAPMAPGAAAAAAEVAAHYSDLELDVDSGRRGNRLSALEAKLTLLSGADAAYVCNNNAAALLLILNTLAIGREVVVSRGELVEIGGSFRVPDIMRRAGVKLVEVGSTNRTHARDYERAIGPDTALLLKVHRSNFEVRGFVKEVELPELVRIGRERGVPVVEDLGSGTLVDLQARGFPPESFAPGRLACEPDLVCFSGDKLMGGPQAGITLGRGDWIDAMRSNPLARALRLDKMTLAALDWTLGSMLDGRAESEVPILRQLLLSPDEYEARSRAFAKRLGEQLSQRSAEFGESAEWTIEVRRDRVPVGGGSLPGFELDAWVVAVRAPIGAAELAARLRSAPLPVLSRIHDDWTLIDLRTVEEDETLAVERALAAASR